MDLVGIDTTHLAGLQLERREPEILAPIPSVQPPASQVDGNVAGIPQGDPPVFLSAVDALDDHRAGRHVVRALDVIESGCVSDGVVTAEKRVEKRVHGIPRVGNR